MINFDFDYYRPSKLDEAYTLYQTLMTSGKKVLYYAGGTEILTAFRKGTLSADAVIDLKAIEGMNRIQEADHLSFGACCNLNLVSQACPELTTVFDQIADHTARNAITIGGNICGRLPYKEVVLPLLAMDAKVVLYSEGGLETHDLRTLFDKRLKMPEGAILYQIQVTPTRVWSSRLTEAVAVDYPLLHLLVSKEGHGCFVGLSGYSAGPVHKVFESCSMDLILDHFQPMARDSVKGTMAYKQALLKDCLMKGLGALEVIHD